MSLNPAIDKRLRLDRLQHGRVNRVMETTPAPGGKAAHVAMVLRTLGADPLWLGFAGGPTGTALIEGLKALSIRTQAVMTANETRMNLEILEKDGTVTEILEPGHPVTSPELDRFRETFEMVLHGSPEKTTIILSGSLPPGVPEDYYATLVELGHQCGSRVFVDTSGEPLRHALKAKPDFIKPNQEEAEWLSGRVIDGPRSAGSALETILAAGAKAGAISLGAQGLVWRTAGKGTLFYANSPQLAGRSTVGSGDSTIAGFAFAQEQEFKAVDSLRLAVACGAANCLAEGPGGAKAVDIERLKKEIRAEKLQM